MALFRLRFRSVRVVRATRAGERKLRVRITVVVLITGPSGCEYPGARAQLFAQLWLLFAWVSDASIFFS